MLLSMVAGGPIVGYEVLDTVQLQHSTVVASRLNGGRYHRLRNQSVARAPIFPGVVVARDLHNGYHEYAASLKALSQSVVVTINDVATEYSVRPFVYF